jgi:hypothetical protein
MSCYAAEPIDIEKNKNNVIYLNTDRDVENARDFFLVPGRDTCRSLDPRLIDVVRDIHMELDRPPLQPRGVQPLRDVYAQDNDRVRPQTYRGGYASIYPGDVQYYLDPSLAQAYDSPVYVQRSAVVPFVFQDPMGGMKPQYDRLPLFDNNISSSAYTFDQDQMSYREDLISRQSRKMNQSDFSIYSGHFPSSLLP